MKRILGVLAVLSLILLSACSDEPDLDAEGRDAAALTSVSSIHTTTQPTTMPTDTAESRPRDTDVPERSGISQLLPQGAVVVDVMELATSPELDELLVRLQTSMQQEPEWWSDYVKAAPPGQPLPYHEKMGLTEAEYTEMLSLMDRLVLRKAGESTLVINSERDGYFSFDGGADLPELTGIEINLDQDVVATPYGVAAQRRTIKASGSQSTTGPWDGVSWSLDTLDLDQETGTYVQFALGRLQESGRGILYYQVKQVEGGKQLADLWIVLNYDLP